MAISVIGVMKMGNMGNMGIEHTSLAFQASILTITSARLPGVTILPIPTCLYSSLHERSVQRLVIFASAFNSELSSPQLLYLMDNMSTYQNNTHDR